MAKPLLRITLSETAQKLLELMAAQQGISKSPMLEILIREAAKAKNISVPARISEVSAAFLQD